MSTKSNTTQTRVYRGNNYTVTTEQTITNTVKIVHDDFVDTHGGIRLGTGRPSKQPEKRGGRRENSGPKKKNLKIEAIKSPENSRSSSDSD